MKKIFALALLFLPVIAMATITAEEEFAINRMSGVARKHSLGTMLAKTPNVVVGKYSYAVQGGAVGDINLLRDLNDSTSTVIIPDNAIITKAYVDVLTSGVSASNGNGVLTIQVASDLKATLIASSWTAGILAASVTGPASEMIKLTADRTLKLTIASAVWTAGKFNAYVEYVLGD